MIKKIQLENSTRHEETFQRRKYTDSKLDTKTLNPIGCQGNAHEHYGET